MRSESLEFLKNLVNAPSPSGYEEPAAEVYRQYTSGFAHDVKTDLHGNVWAILNPQAQTRLMLAGHMDEIGFQVHYIDDDGFLFFRPIGGHDRMVLLGQRVWVHGKERVPGVMARKPIHLLNDADRTKVPEYHEMWIDIGVKSREQAEELVSIGDPVTYQDEFQNLQGDRVAARGFDNKSGSWIVAEALRLLAEDGGLDEQVGVYAVATVQEEIGLRGARTASYAIDAVAGLAVDVDFAIDHPGVSKARYGRMDLGGGPGVVRGANVNPIVFKMLVTAAKEDGITVQVNAEPGGTGTDANAMQLARGGMAVGLMGLPLRYMHSPVEVITLGDIEQCAKLMAAFCRRVTPTTDFTPRLG